MKQKRRKHWSVLLVAILAAVIFAAGIAQNVVAAYIQKRAEPYMLWMYILLVLGLIAAAAIAVFSARSSEPASHADSPPRVSVEFVDGRRVAVQVTNEGKSDLHIRRADLSYAGMPHKERPVQLLPSESHRSDGLLIPKMQVDANGGYLRSKLVLQIAYTSADEIKRILQTAAEADISTFILDVWAEENPDAAIWHAEGDQLADLHSTIQSEWNETVSNHPCYPHLRKMLRLQDDARFADWEGLKALAEQRGYEDRTGGDESNYWLCAFRREDGIHELRVARSLFDMHGKLLPMLPQEWDSNLIAYRVEKHPDLYGTQSRGDPPAW